MAYSQHTIYGGALVAVIIAACVAGVVITGGPGEARKQKEDIARMEALSRTSIALACYYQAKGNIPEDLSIVEEELSHVTSDARQQDYCSMAEMRKDPISGKPFRLKREGRSVTHICADFATADPDNSSGYVPFPVAAGNIIPDYNKPRLEAGEYCLELNLAGKLEY